MADPARLARSEGRRAIMQVVQLSAQPVSRRAVLILTQRFSSTYCVDIRTVVMGAVVAARTMLIRSGADLGASIAEARLVRGLTQEGLAGQSGVERTYLARLEAGLSVQMLERSLDLLRLLGADVVVTLPEAPSVEEAAFDGRP